MRRLDWFDSTEICIEATIAGLFAYIAVVHMLTARDPFIKPVIFKDRNFLLGTMLSAVTGVFLTGVIPIMTSMMQQLLGYPVLLAGLISTPRAIGNLLTIMVVGRLVSVIDARYLIFAGMALLVGSLSLLSSMSLEVSQVRMGFVTFLQGCGSGLLFLPLTMIVFSTLPREHRNEGSTIFTLVRNLSGAAGISLIQAATIRDQAQVQSHLVERVRADNHGRDQPAGSHGRLRQFLSCDPDHGRARGTAGAADAQGVSCTGAGTFGSRRVAIRSRSAA